MRKSLERRKQKQAKEAALSRRHRAAIPLCVGVTLLAIGAAAGFLWSADTDERHQSATRQTQLAKELSELESHAKAAAQKKLDEARRREEVAKESPTSQTGEKAAEATSCATANPTSISVVINKRRCFSPSDWAPSDLVAVDGHLLRAEAAAQLQELRKAAAAAGAPIELSSAYRSYASQAATYANWTSINGSSTVADTVSARPGYSEHQTGLAVDLKIGTCYLECFGGTSQYQWLVKHAADYGFILRYPEGLSHITGYSSESWHWRYVGASTARDMKVKRIATLEAYFNVPGGDYSASSR